MTYLLYLNGSTEPTYYDDLDALLDEMEHVLPDAETLEMRVVRMSPREKWREVWRACRIQEGGLKDAEGLWAPVLRRACELYDDREYGDTLEERMKILDEKRAAGLHIHWSAKVAIFRTVLWLDIPRGRVP